jgi:transcriptional regulator with XRE-family HTH domain
MAAENRMGELGLTQETLAKTAGVDPTTVNGFLNGRNWPQPRTRAKLEVALDWPVGMLARIDAGEEPPDETKAHTVERLTLDLAELQVANAELRVENAELRAEVKRLRNDGNPVAGSG